MSSLKSERTYQGLTFQNKFFTLFNALSPEKYHLVPSTQDYETFDFYLFKVGEVEPFIIEFKSRSGHWHDTYQETLVDYLKIMKLRAMSKKAYVIVCYEDLSIVVDVTANPDAIILGEFDNREKPVALYKIEGLKTIPISLEDLRAIE